MQVWLGHAHGALWQRRRDVPESNLSLIPGARLRHGQPVSGGFQPRRQTDLAYVAANGDLVVLLSIGDGTFKQLVTTPANSKLATVAAVDMNRDGIPDLLAALIGLRGV